MLCAPVVILAACQDAPQAARPQAAASSSPGVTVEGYTIAPYTQSGGEGDCTAMRTAYFQPRDRINRTRVTIIGIHSHPNGQRYIAVWHGRFLLGSKVFADRHTLPGTARFPSGQVAPVRGNSDSGDTLAVMPLATLEAWIQGGTVTINLADSTEIRQTTPPPVMAALARCHLQRMVEAGRAERTADGFALDLEPQGATRQPVRRLLAPVSPTGTPALQGLRVE